jgi:hypothetical protein
LDDSISGNPLLVVSEIAFALQVSCTAVLRLHHPNTGSQPDRERLCLYSMTAAVAGALD